MTLVRICVELLYDLAVWLTEARCPHYFINNCNFIDSSFNLDMIRNQLISIRKSWLSSWFVNSYVRRCSQLCSPTVSRLFDDVSTITKLQNAVSAVVDFRLLTVVLDMLVVFSHALIHMTSLLSRYSLTVRSPVCWFNELRKISASLPVYFLSAAFMHCTLLAEHIEVV